jgi:Fe2+ transport system protein FeoA
MTKTNMDAAHLYARIKTLVEMSPHEDSLLASSLGLATPGDSTELRQKLWIFGIVAGVAIALVLACLLAPEGSVRILNMSSSLGG